MLEAAGGEARVDHGTPEQARALLPSLRATKLMKGLASVEDLLVRGADGMLAARLYRPVGDGSVPVIVFFHGGGWVTGSLDSHDRLAGQLAADSGCAVISVDYRLAPEHKFPAPLEDAYNATAWVAEHAEDLGLRTDRLAVAGDSAGGNLAAAVCLLARDRSGPEISLQILLYPITDLTMNHASYREFGDAGYLLTTRAMRWFINHYVGGVADVDWRAAPLQAPDLTGLPAALVVTADLDPLRDEGEKYAHRLAEAGNEVDIRRAPGMCHGYLAFPVDESLSTRAAVAQIVRGHWALHTESVSS